jgi:ubiquinone/menaquinone biosynthesis C-methylase UbiE
MAAPGGFLRAKVASLRRRPQPDTSTTARFWATRHIETPEIGPTYWDTRNAPYRTALAERLCARATGDSFLEVGCACGPNLWALGQRLPDAQLAGVDVSEAAIRYGRHALAREGINADLRAAMAHELPYATGQFDVVFTCGTLVCVGPDAIARALTELVRVSRGTIFLLEGGSPTREETDPYPNTMYWRRDYSRWLHELVADRIVHVEPVPSELVHGHLDTYFKLVIGDATTSPGASVQR